MRLQIFFLSLLVCLLLTVAASAQVTIFSGDEDWQDLLKIEDDEDYLAGLTLTLALDPDTYYKRAGDEIRIFGEIKSIFGPLSDALIIVEQRNETSLCKQIPVRSDKDGYFIITDTLDVTEKISYQSLFSLDINSDDSNFSSPRIELSVLENEDTVSETYTSPENETISSEEESRHINYSPLSFSTNVERYTPGEIIILNGTVKDISGRPDPYKKVQIGLKTHGSGKTSGAERKMTYHTGSDGTINVSYHLTGPYPIEFFMELPSTGQIIKEVSDTLTLTPEPIDISPPSRIIPEKEQIDAHLVSNSVNTQENVTVHGWYSYQNGSGGILLPLELVWYNFGGRIWDKYPKSTEIITNADGYFTCTLSAPSTPGAYLLSIRTVKTVTKSHVYSNILNLIVKEPELSVEPVVEYQYPQLSLFASPSIGRTGEMTQLLVLLSDTTGNLLINNPVQLFQSDDGIEWRILSDSLVTNESGEIIIGIIPEKPGYQYYRAITQITEYDIISSDTFVLPVL